MADGGLADNFSLVPNCTCSFVSKETNGLVIPKRVASSTPATLGSITIHCSENRSKSTYIIYMYVFAMNRKARTLHVFAINRVMLLQLRTGDCANNSSDIAGKLASLRV